ncbi:MAG: serine/threonine protein kinase [Anaerolineales bacterium]|nr:serine/threonine protein kinase [Anaerolineales bacterium]
MEELKLLNNRYQLNSLVGRGGMAMVFNGKDLMLERDVAVKVLRSRYAKDPAFRERFRQEAKAAANLSHPNIVTVYDFGFDQSRLYIVMEYVAGKDLNTLVHERGRVDLDRGLDLAIKACKGIGYAHRAGLVHCDVKPHNLLITPHWQLKVTDFGIARALASINPDETSDVVWGSPQFFSPEQASGEAPSPASDVYSLGVVMYLMFTGQLPFTGKSSQELAKLHREASPLPPSEINPLLPETLDEVILKVLSKEPSARYRTADQLGRVLQIVQREQLHNGPPDARRGSNSLPSRRPESVASDLLIQPRPAPRISEQQTGFPRGDTPPPQPASALTISDVDWLAVLLGLAAVVAWGGLVPFFIWVYNSIF